MSALLARALMVLVVLLTVVGLAYKPATIEGEDAITVVAAEHAQYAVQPDNPDEDGDIGPGMSESAFAEAAPPPPSHAEPPASPLHP
jgi:hypothetical protein